LEETQRLHRQLLGIFAKRKQATSFSFHRWAAGLENPNRAKVVNGSTWTGFFPSSSYLTFRLRESAA
jgi:hypothetical protein